MIFNFRSKTGVVSSKWWAMAFLASVFLGFTPNLWGQASDSGFEIISFHSQRYQDFTENRIKCEVFGEIKNTGSRNLKGVTVAVDYMDEKGKKVGSEEMVLILRVIAPRNPVGDARPVKPGEYGNFNQDTVQCPDPWLEGRIRYKVVKTDWQ